MKKYLLLLCLIPVAVLCAIMLSQHDEYRRFDDFILSEMAIDQQDSEVLGISDISQDIDLRPYEIEEPEPEAPVEYVEVVEPVEPIEPVDDGADQEPERELFNPAEPKSVHQLDDEEHSKDNISFIIDDPGGADRSIMGSQLNYTAPVNPALSKTVMGFAPYWALDGYYQQYHMDKLSIIAYFALTCYDNGEWVTTDTGWSAWNSTAMTNLINTAHANGVKVVLVVKNFHNRSIRDIVANTNGARDKLLDNIMIQVNAKNVDGVNIDFEYISDATYPVTDTLRANLATFMDLLADRMHSERPGSHVSVDVFGSSGGWYNAYDIAALGATSIDSIMVMSYDFHTTSYYAGKVAGPESPLYGNQYWYNVSKSMNDIVAKTSANKVIMGVPYYGIDWPVAPEQWGAKNAIVTGSGVIESYRSITDPVYDEWHNASTVQWDDADKMTWYRYVYYGQYRQGYYDDSQSLGAKYDFVNSNGLGGIGIWALGYDHGRSELWNVIDDYFTRATYELFE